MTQRRVFGDSISSLLDRAALVGAFVIGITGVIGLKALGVGPITAILFPVLVLLGYVLLCLAAGRLQVEPETIGDNCYYLGFLFTLGSLSASLFQMRGASGAAGAELLVPIVISGFGVALSSTIAGVFLRVLLLQMRTDIVALDREARRDMQAAMRDLRADMSAASSAFRAMAIEAAQRAAERQAEVEALSDPAVSAGVISEMVRIEAERRDRESQLLEAIQRLAEARPLPEPAPAPSAIEPSH
jgi:hypothetical protein